MAASLRVIRIGAESRKAEGKRCEMSWLKSLFGGGNTPRNLSERFSQLLQAKSAQDIERILSEYRNRGFTLDDIDRFVKEAGARGQRVEAVKTCYRGMVVTLLQQDWDGCYACVSSAFYHGARGEGQLLLDVITTAWPILAFCETHNPKGPQFFAIAMIMNVLAQAGKEHAPNDSEFYSALSLAMNAVGIIYGRAAKLRSMPFEASNDAMMTAQVMEGLGLKGATDWVVHNMS